MSIEGVVAARLASAIPAVSNRVHGGHRPPSDASPSISYTVRKERPEQAMGASSGIVRCRFRISAWATTYDVARDVMNEIRDAFDRWTTTAPDLAVDDSFLGDEDDEDFEEQLGLYEIPIEVEVIMRTL